MPKQNPLLNIVKKQKEGKAVAIYSCCSSNAFVIEAAMKTGSLTPLFTTELKHSA